MSLTRKQRKYIGSHHKRQTVEQMSQHLGVAPEAVAAHLRETGGPGSTGAAMFPAAGGAPSDTERLLQRFMWLILAVVSLLVGIYCFDAKLYISGDNVDFMDLGSRILDGDIRLGYGKFPIGFPLLLAIAQAVSDQSLLAQKIFILLCYVSVAPLLYLMFEGLLGWRRAAMLALVSVMSPLLVEFSHYVMSEVPYLAFSLGALYFFQRSRRDDFSWGKPNWWMTVAFIVMAYYIRTAGLALLAATVGYFLLRARWRTMLHTAGLFLLVVLPLPVSNHFSGGQSYSEQLFSVNPYHPEQGMLTLPTLLARVTENLRIYFLGDIPQVVLPLRFETTMVHAPDYPALVALAISALVLAGLVREFLIRRSLVALYVTAMLGILLLWPQMWSGGRFLIPLIPFLFYLALVAVDGLCALAGRWFRFRRGHVVTAAVLLLLLVLQGRNVLAYRNFMEAYPPGWANYFKAADWVRENTPEDVIIADRKGGLFRIASKRKTAGFLLSEDHRALIQQLRKDDVDFVSVPLGIGYAHIQIYLVPAINAYPALFRVAYQIGNPENPNDPPTYILQFDKHSPLPE